MKQSDFFIPQNDAKAVIAFARIIKDISASGFWVMCATSYSDWKWHSESTLGDALNRWFTDALVQYPKGEIWDLINLLRIAIVQIDPSIIELTLKQTEFEIYTGRILGVRSLIKGWVRENLQIA